MNSRATTRWTLLVALIAAGVLVATTTARAEPTMASEPLGPAPALFNHSKPLSKMTLPERAASQEKALKHYRSVVRFYLSWRKANALPSVAVTRTLSLEPVPHVRCAVLGIITPRNVCWYAHAASWTAAELRKTELKITRLVWSGDVCSASKAACAWYADGATQCEVAHEGAWTSVNSAGYYGRFQMDTSFQQETPFGAAAYAQYGTAEKWPPSVQIQQAFNVWSYAGWSRWPPYSKYGCSTYHGRAYSTA